MEVQEKELIKEIENTEEENKEEKLNCEVIETEVENIEKENKEEVENNQNEEENTKSIKKFPAILFGIIIFVIIACLLFIGYRIYCYYNPKEPEIIPITSIEISIPELEIETNTSVEISTIIEPLNYNTSNLQWISSNPEILTVENGKITALAEGESTVYVVNDNGVKSNEILVHSIVKIKGIALSKDSLEIDIGKSETLIATITPENATNKNLIWKSSNKDIASVDESGIVTGNNIGECIVSVSSDDESIISECKVKVNAIEVSSVSLDENNVILGVGQEYLLIGSVSPNNATYKSLIWSSSNNGIITVNNGKIKAIAEGNAVVTITSKNGKVATCNFTVNSSTSSGTIKYAKDAYSIRSGPSTNYSKLATVYKNEEIEILKVFNSWSKVRTSSGIVGYILSEGYSSSKTYFISNVPYLNQFTLGYPTGCEAVSATMAAKYAGYNVSSAQVIAATPTDEKGKRQETKTIEITEEKVNEETGEVEIITKTEEQTDWYGGNPFEVFVGHPTKGLSTGSYGCYAKPITVALQACGVPATNISGCSIDTVFNYVANGKPVIVWCKKNAGDLTEGVTWKYEDGSGSYTELVGEHCAVLIGYDGEYVYLNDPSAGQNVKQPKAKFTSNWYKLFSQAVVIK